MPDGFFVFEERTCGCQTIFNLGFLPGCPNEQASVETHWSSKAEKNLNFGELAKLCDLNPKKKAKKICIFERAGHKVGQKDISYRKLFRDLCFYHCRVDSIFIVPPINSG